MSPIHEKLYDELLDKQDKIIGWNIIERLIKYGPQYSVLIIDTNGKTKKHLNKWIYINPEKKSVDLIDLNNPVLPD